MKKDIMVIRDSIGKIVSLLTKQSIKVTQRGMRACVNYHPKTGEIVGMNIPYIPDDASDEFIAAIQGFLDHEVGHVLYSDFDALKKAVAKGKRVANLANLVEDVYVERKMTEAFRGSGVNLESVRQFYLEKIARPKIMEALDAGNIEAARGYATVAAFRAWGGQHSAADFIKDPVIADLVAPVKAKIGSLVDEIAKCDSSAECLDLAVKLKKKLEEKPEEKPPAPPPPPPPKAEPEPEPSAEPESEPAPELEEPAADPGSDPGEEPGDSGSSSEEPGDAGDADAEGGEGSPADPDGAGDSEASSDPAAESDAPSEDDSISADPEAESADPESGGAAGGDPLESPDGDTPAEGTPETGEGDSAFTDGEGTESPTGLADTDEGSLDAAPPLADMFDEERDFDKDMSKRLTEDATKEIEEADYAVFSTEWDSVVPAPLARFDSSVERLDMALREKVGVMQKQLERAMVAQSRKCWNPGQLRGRIAPGSLFKTAVGDDRVFRQRFETRAKNTAVSLVVDCSGSMSGSKIRLAGYSAYALSSVLERLKINHEVIGFTTTANREMMRLMQEDAEATGKDLYRAGWGRIEALYMPVFKEFGGKLDSKARSRMAHLTESPGWLCQNVDGESVQVAARRLAVQRAERHVMIVLSDGEPAAVAARGLNAHLKKTVKAITAQGIEVIGIGIQSNAVKAFYPKHTILHDEDELPTRVMQELTKLLLAP